MMLAKSNPIVLAILLLISSCCPARASEPTQAAGPAPQTTAALPGSSGSQYADTDICKTCHQEISTNPRLLQVNNINFLCLRCHTPNMNGAAGRPIGPNHDQATKYQACTMCHTQIHGSNFSPVFFR